MSKKREYCVGIKIINCFYVEAENRTEAEEIVRSYDPYKTLGVEPHTNIREIKNKWIKMSKEIHPDKLLASGVPKEFINKNTKKLQDINNAWEKIKKQKNNSNFLQS